MRDDDHRGGGNRDSRERRPWREVDNSSRGRKDHAGRGRNEDAGPSAAASKSYRAQLERMFDKGEAAKLLGDRASRGGPGAPGGGGPPGPASPGAGPPGAAADATPEAKLALMRAVKQAIGPEAITQAVDALVARYPLPDDLEVLEQVLEHRDKKHVSQAMQRLLRQLDRVRPKRARTMLAKLRTIEENSGDAELIELAVKVRNKLLG